MRRISQIPHRCLHFLYTLESHLEEAEHKFLNAEIGRDTSFAKVCKVELQEWVINDAKVFKQLHKPALLVDISISPTVTLKQDC